MSWRGIMGYTIGYTIGYCKKKIHFTEPVVRSKIWSKLIFASCV